MATYYVDLDLSGTGGTGTELDPWHADSFKTTIGIGSLAAGSIFNIKGSVSWTDFTIYSPGSGIGYILQNWDVNSPWRINASNGNIISYGGTNKLYNAIIGTAAGYFNCNGPTELYGCYLKLGLALNVWGAGYGGATGTSKLIGCTLICNLTSWTQGNVTLNLIDSILATPQMREASGGILTSNYCAFTNPPYNGSHTNYQYGWVPPTWPAWDGALLSFSKSLLNYSTINTPIPSPGFGYPSYIGYENDLSGNTRNDIGAYSSEVYYADLDLTGTGGTGTELDPWHADTFQIQMASAGYADGTVFKIRGGHRYTTNFNFYSQGEVGVWHDGYVLENWDQNNPWRISSSGNIESKGGRNRFYNGILYCDSFFYCYDSSEFYDCFIKPSQSFFVYGVSYGGHNSNLSIVKGCNIICNSHVVTVQSSVADAVLDVYDSILCSGQHAQALSPAVLTTTNCVFVVNPVQGTHTNAQIGWVNPTWPVWDATLASFYKSVLNYSTILSGPGNPSPGIGFPDYTEYEKDLSGYTRDDIGAYSSSQLTTTVTPTTATPTTVAPTTTTIAPTTTPTTVAPTTSTPTTVTPTTVEPTTVTPTTIMPTTVEPTTIMPTTVEPTTVTPTTVGPTTIMPTTVGPTTIMPTTVEPTTVTPTTSTISPTTTLEPTTTPPPAMIYYVDLSQTYTGSGTITDCFNFDQFKSTVPNPRDIFKLKGSINTDIAVGKNNDDVDYTIESWDLATYGPWRIQCNDGHGVKILAGKISNGIIYSINGSIELTIYTKITNTFLKSANIIKITNANVNGCTLISANTIDTTNTIFNDCIIDEIMGSNTATYNNCVFSASDWGSGTKNDCQFNWLPPEWPLYDAQLTNFYKLTLNYSTITTPPEPGIGSPDYLEYNKDLSGYARNDIGAYASYKNPEITGQTIVPKVYLGAYYTINLTNLIVETRYQYPGNFTLIVNNGKDFNIIDATSTNVKIKITGNKSITTRNIPVTVNDGTSNSNTYNFIIVVVTSKPDVQHSLTVLLQKHNY